MLTSVEPTPLAAELAERGPLPLEEAVSYTLAICESVAEAHAAGVAHGDLRPENVFLLDGPAGRSVEVAFDGARTGSASRQDVAHDIAALGGLLRALLSGTNDYELEGAITLPSEVSHIVARALAQEWEGSFQNVAELARELAPFAPPDHPSARRIALLMSRAGIVGSGIPLPAAQAGPGDDAWFGPPTTREHVFADEDDDDDARQARRLLFAFVSLVLVGFAVGGSLFLWRSELLPRWTGVAPPAIGTTTLTSAPTVPLEDLASVPVEQLPNAPAFAEPVAPAHAEAPASVPASAEDDTASAR